MSITMAVDQISMIGKEHVTATARKLVLRHLSKLHTGSLIVIEDDQRLHFGELLPSNHDLYAEMIVKDPSCYLDILLAGTIGAAESFITKDWLSPDLTSVVRVMVKNLNVMDDVDNGFARLSQPLKKWFHKRNQNTPKGSRRNIASHYDLGNNFFKLFLDETMMYSSGIFPKAESSLLEASEHKLQRICEQLDLQPGDKVVEVGTGWGGFAIYAAKNYGCHVTTTTISDQQYRLAKERIQSENLVDRITLLNKDYRELEGHFDKLVSIEMIEAVGWQFYDTFFNKCASLLKRDGLMLIQAITITDQRFEKAKDDVDFIQKYIFPGSCIPSIQTIVTSTMNSSDLRLIKLEDYAEHYARTLNAWCKRLYVNIDEIKGLGYSDDFIRMWTFYLSYCEGGFLERSIGVSHMLFARPDCRSA